MTSKKSCDTLTGVGQNLLNIFKKLINNSGGKDKEKP
jgi:hypothetical protein